MFFLGSEVTKGLWAKKQAKMKRSLSEPAHKSNQMKEKMDKAARRSEPEDKVNLNQKFVFVSSYSFYF